MGDTRGVFARIYATSVTAHSPSKSISDHSGLHKVADLCDRCGGHR
jgi:hypothetical protein